MMNEAAIAAERYRHYKAEKRKQTMQKTILSLLLKLFEVIAKVLQNAKIVRRKVETVKVE